MNANDSEGCANVASGKLHSARIIGNDRDGDLRVFEIRLERDLSASLRDQIYGHCQKPCLENGIICQKRAQIMAAIALARIPNRQKTL